MTKQIVVAYGNNREIGANNELLWRMPADFAHFKALTMGGSLVMGRNTWESIGRPLPGRESIVVTSGEIDVPDVKVARSFDEALGMASRELVSILGGGQLYRAAVEHPDVTVVEATHVHGDFPKADVFFPELSDQWQLQSTESHPADDANPHVYDFVRYTKK